MENKEVKIEATTLNNNEEALMAMLQAMSEKTDLPRGTVDEIFNLGVKTERERQNLIRGSRLMKDLKKEQKKAEKKQKPCLTERIMRKLGYAPIPKEETKKDKSEEKKEETKK